MFGNGILGRMKQKISEKSKALGRRVADVSYSVISPSFFLSFFLLSFSLRLVSPPSKLLAWKEEEEESMRTNEPIRRPHRPGPAE